MFLYAYKNNYKVIINTLDNNKFEGTVYIVSLDSVTVNSSLKRKYTIPFKSITSFEVVEYRQRI